MNVYGNGAWRMQPFKDCPALYTNRPPCWFHRLIQRWLLGFRWTRDDCG